MRSEHVDEPGSSGDNKFPGIGSSVFMVVGNVQGECEATV